MLAITAAAATYIIPEPPSAYPNQRKELAGVKLRQLDLPGGAVGITALVLFNFSWNQAFIVIWFESYIIITLLLGVLLIPIFFLIEVRFSRIPVLPLDAITGDVGFVLGCVSCGWACFGIWIYY